MYYRGSYAWQSEPAVREATDHSPFTRTLSSRMERNPDADVQVRPDVFEFVQAPQIATGSSAHVVLNHFILVG